MLSSGGAGRARLWSTKGAGVVPLVGLAATVVLGLALAFAWSTDFIGDDHLFLAWARYAPSPLDAFVQDVHGGEYDRPLPLFVWWCLGRLGRGSRWPFAVFMAGGHALAAWLLMRLLLLRGEGRPVALGAAALFFFAPAQIDAMSWYAASTDLLACVGLLASLRAALRGAPWWRFLFLATAAFLSKESAVVLPVCLMIVLPWPPDASTLDDGPRGRIRRVLVRAPLGAVVVATALVIALAVRRRWLLGGWGGAGDERPAFFSRVFLVGVAALARLSGLPAAVEPVFAALVGGVAALILLVLAKTRTPGAARTDPRGETPPAQAGFASTSAPTPAWVPWALFGVLLLPLLAVPEGLATRYTYAPTLALAWGVARILFGSARPRSEFSAGRGWLVSPAAIPGGLVLLGLVAGAGLQVRERAREITRYRGLVAAARSAVAAGVARGGRLFHVSAGIKDLDLAVKEAPGLAPLRHEFWVLCDVPASFVFEPPALFRSLVAVPPLPPSGAYRFGAERIVGLARRGDEPGWDEAFARWPDLRLLRPCAAPGASSNSAFAFCDETERLRATTGE
jgi:hypothetical protein